MKIEKIHFKNHKVLGNLELDLKDKSGEILDLVVLAGINGSGKTSTLDTIYQMFFNQSNNYDECYLTLDIDIKKENKNIVDIQNHIKKYNKKNCNINYMNNFLEEIFDDSFSQLVYFPTEVNFQNVRMTNNITENAFKRVKKIDSGIITNASAIIYEYLKEVEEDEKWNKFNHGVVKQKILEEIQDTFKDFKLKIKIKGYNKKKRNIVFENEKGDVIDINDISSGEKQLFIRTFLYKALNVNNSIILIDEPEISLHPEWQQLIIDVYKNIGKNNQIIIATHSPHIISSVKPENLIILNNVKSQIKALPGKDYGNSYGVEMRVVLEDIMGLKDQRNPYIFKLFEKARKLLNEKKHETEEFKKIYNELENAVGYFDLDFVILENNLVHLEEGE